MPPPPHPALHLDADATGGLSLWTGHHRLLDGSFVEFVGADEAAAIVGIERNDAPGLVRMRGYVSGRARGSVVAGPAGTWPVEVNVVAAVVPPGDALVWLIDVVNRGDAACTVEATTRLALAGPLAHAVPTEVAGLGAVAAAAETPVGRLVLAHTLVPDDGPRGTGDAAERPGRAAGIPSEPGVLTRQRRMTLAPGASGGLTAVVGVGATVRDALEAVFPHLSGERSREALRAAHRLALDAHKPPAATSMPD